MKASTIKSDGLARTGRKGIMGGYAMVNSLPFEIKDCGHYGIQLYIFRNEGIERYSMSEIVISLACGSVTKPTKKGEPEIEVVE